MRFAWSNFSRVFSLLALLVVAAADARASSPPASPDEAAWNAERVRAIAPPPGVRVLTSLRLDSSGRAIDDLERAGYHVDVAVLPGTFFVRPNAGAGPLPADFVDATTGSAGPDWAIVEPVAPAVPMVALDHVLLPPRDPEPGRAAGRGPLLAPGDGTGLYYGTRWKDTSELMIGRVAVPLLFPESDGSLDPNRYDWTPALRDSVVRSAVRAFLKWTALASVRGVPLTFLIEVYPALPTRYEPIDRPVAEETGWMADVLAPLVGYRGDPVAMGYELANAARARLGAQWATLLFAVQNTTDPNGVFPDANGEHALLGGPYFVVLAKPSNSAGGATLDYYIQHELAHVFWALDEYPFPGWWACTLTTGYFNQQNSNSGLPAPGYCAPNAQCFMYGLFPDSLCAPTQRQIGWVDLDQTGVLDLFETRPSVRPDSSSYHGASGGTITIRGAASDAALPNRNPYHFGAGDSITIATVDSIWHRLDNGPWIPVDPDDGVFDEGSERFTFALPPPGVGNHLLEFQALNSNGFMMAIPASVIVTVSGGTTGVVGPEGEAAAVRPFLGAGPSPSDGSVQFSLRGTRGAPATARLFDVAGRVVRSWSLHVPESGQVEWVWDGRAERGETRAGGLYFLVVDVGPERLTRRIVILH